MRYVLPFLLLLRLSICQDQSPAREDQPYGEQAFLLSFA